MDCNHAGKLVIEVLSSRKGLYCCECGKWIKWVGKDEFNLLRFKDNVKVVYGGK